MEIKDVSSGTSEAPRGSCEPATGKLPSPTSAKATSEMVKVSIEVRNGAALFMVAVRAQSIERAATVVRGSYPGCKIRVKSPIDTEDSFVPKPVPQVGIVGVKRPEFIAA
jgi:hypothetical protein